MPTQSAGAPPLSYRVPGLRRVLGPAIDGSGCERKSLALTSRLMPTADDSSVVDPPRAKTLEELPPLSSSGSPLSVVRLEPCPPSAL